MSNRAMLGMASKVEARVRKVIHCGRNAYGCLKNGGLQGPCEFIRSITYNRGEGTSESTSTRETRPAAAAYKHFLDGNTLKEAVAKLMERATQGISVSSYAYNYVLRWCSEEKDLESVKKVHDSIRGSEMEQHPYVGNMLLKCYIECGRMDSAQETLNKILTKGTVTWNMMISGCVKHDKADGAIEMYNQMRKEGGEPNAVTYLSVLKACASLTALKWGKVIHTRIIRDGFEADVLVGKALLRMYTSCGSLGDARAVFDRLGQRDVVTWTMMMGALAEHGLGDEAFSLFLQMQREGLKPEAITYVKILHPSSSTGSTEWVKKVHAHATRAGLDVDMRVGTALVQMYAKSGRIEDASAVFDRLGRRDVVCWTVMIGGFAKHGLGHEAFSLFLQMQREGLTPDVITYLNILNPCASTGAEEWLKEVHVHAMQANLDTDVQVGSALVQMYAKTGLIADAKHVFEKMRTRDVISWAVMVGGLAHHGHGREALQLFEEMKLNGVQPNGAMFVAVLSACSHAGLVEEGHWQFESMRRDFGMEPALEHYNCMVDMLGRVGRLKDAELFILSMPISPDIVTWITFLGACKSYKNIKLAELAAKECMKLNPMDVSAYVLLSNVYAAVGDWEHVRSILSLMQDRGIRKDPGRCGIEVGNKVHYFLVGDTSHPEKRAIYSMLSSLSEKLKAEGYIADTRILLRNTVEEDKESVICSHTEKLAIAYGLMHLPPGKPIRVYKNLRICTDCHAATKLISKITGREIVARDAIRFHHFKDGLCSCGDYW